MPSRTGQGGAGPDNARRGWAMPDWDMTGPDGVMKSVSGHEVSAGWGPGRTWQDLDCSRTGHERKAKCKVAQVQTGYGRARLVGP